MPETHTGFSPTPSVPASSVSPGTPATTTSGEQEGPTKFLRSEGGGKQGTTERRAMSARVHVDAQAGPARAGSGGAAGSAAVPAVVVRLQDPGEVDDVSSEHSSIRSSRSSLRRRLAINAEKSRIAQLELERLNLEAELSQAGSQSSHRSQRLAHASEPSSSAADLAAGSGPACPGRPGSSTQPGDLADDRSGRPESVVTPAVAANPGKCEATNPDREVSAARAVSDLPPAEVCPARAGSDVRPLTLVASRPPQTELVLRERGLALPAVEEEGSENGMDADDDGSARAESVRGVPDPALPQDARGFHGAPQGPTVFVQNNVMNTVNEHVAVAQVQLRAHQAVEATRVSVHQEATTCVDASVRRVRQ